MAKLTSNVPIVGLPADIGKETFSELAHTFVMVLCVTKTLIKLAAFFKSAEQEFTPCHGENTHHSRHAICPERQQIIYRLGGHSDKVPLFFCPFLPTHFASIDHCLRKRVCDSNAVIRILAVFANPCVSVGIDFWILNWSFLSRAVINIIQRHGLNQALHGCSLEFYWAQGSRLPCAPFS